MEKLLLNNVEDFKKWIYDNSGHGYCMDWTYIKDDDSPKKYPCILMIYDVYNPNGKDYYIWDFVYQSDFNLISSALKGMKNEYPDLIVKCRKCKHTMYINKIEFINVMSKLQPNCPECDEDGKDKWIIEGEGNFKNLMVTIGSSFYDTEANKEKYKKYG